MSDIASTIEEAMRSIETAQEPASDEENIHIPDHADHFSGLPDEPENNGPKSELRDSVARAFDATKAAKEDSSAVEDAAPVKDEDDAVPSNDEDNAESQPREKDVKAEKSDQEATESDDAPKEPQPEKSEYSKKHAEAPARFLPKSREVWANVPNAVKADFHRITKEYDDEIAEFKQAASNYEEIREYDELARSSGTSLKTALNNYVQLETLLRNSPEKGIEAILSAIGLTPADYVAHITAKQSNVPIAPQNPQQQHDYGRRLEQQIGSLQNQIDQYHQISETRAVQESVNSNIVMPFAMEAPRFKELEGGIVAFLESGLVPSNMNARDRLEEAYHMAAFAKDAPRFNELQADVELFLESGRIPNSLNPLARLEAAYDMAERINPLSVKAPEIETSTVYNRRPANLDGKKSIKGNAASGKTRPVPSGLRVDTVEDSVRAAMAKLNLS